MFGQELINANGCIDFSAARKSIHYRNDAKYTYLKVDGPVFRLAKVDIVVSDTDNAAAALSDCDIIVRKKISHDIKTSGVVILLCNNLIHNIDAGLILLYAENLLSNASASKSSCIGYSKRTQKNKTVTDIAIAWRCDKNKGTVSDYEISALINIVADLFTQLERVTFIYADDHVTLNMAAIGAGANTRSIINMALFIVLVAMLVIHYYWVLYITQ
jgi:hypothetical protein